MCKHKENNPMNAFQFGLARRCSPPAPPTRNWWIPMPATAAGQPSPEARAFAKMPLPFEPAYMLDEGAHPFTKLFDGYRSDPRLLAGINLNRYLALEAGYAERQDRGFHAIDLRATPLDTERRPRPKGFHSYAASRRRRRSPTISLPTASWALPIASGAAWTPWARRKTSTPAPTPASARNTS
jgi:hypothetical protein